MPIQVTGKNLRLTKSSADLFYSEQN